MKQQLKALCLAFSMYSRIPVPVLSYSEESAGYVFCYFPLIGAAIGLIQLAVCMILNHLQAGLFLKGAVLAAVPVLISGGIHLDGFLDTVDARSSYAGREKKLEILKDPHTGAFALIWGGLYLLADAGAWSEAGLRICQCMTAAFVMERALSALTAELLAQAGSRSSLEMYRKEREKKAVCVTSVCWILAAIAAMGWVWPAGALCAGIVQALILIRYVRIARREFGGIRGDLAGWFLQTSELAVLLSLVMLEKLLSM